jgi:hypothetical protein
MPAGCSCGAPRYGLLAIAVPAIGIGTHVVAFSYYKAFALTPFRASRIPPTST